jgi:hypothetical protein
MSDEERPWIDAPYTRVYHTISNRMGEDWQDDAFLAAWLRLLVLADRLYPTVPPLPRWLDDAILDRLVAAELIRRVGPDGYEVAGLEKERAAQRLGKRAGGLARAAQAALVGRGQRGQFVAAGSTSIPPAAGDQQPPATTSIPPATPPPARPAPPATTSTSTSTSTDEGREKVSGRKPSRRARPTREAILLTKEQVEAWSSFGPEWTLTKAAWLARGFGHPPSGQPTDDPEESQRAVLFSVLDSRGDAELAAMIREARPGLRAKEVVGHVLRRWHSIQAAVPPDVPTPRIIRRASEPEPILAGADRHSVAS